MRFGLQAGNKFVKHYVPLLQNVVVLPISHTLSFLAEDGNKHKRRTNSNSWDFKQSEGKLWQQLWQLGAWQHLHLSEMSEDKLFLLKKDDRNQGLFGHLQQKLIQSDLSFENGVWRQLVGLCFSGRGGRPLHILGAGSVSSLECLSVTFKYVQYLLFSLSGPRHLIGFNLDFGIGQDKSGTFSFWAHKGSHFFLSFFPCSV